MAANFTTNEAFTLVINKRGVYKKLGITSDAVRNLRRRNASGEFISTDKKIEVLIKAGFKIIQDMRWEG